MSLLRRPKELKAYLEQKEQKNNELKNQLIKAEKHNRKLENQLWQIRSQENIKITSLKEQIKKLEKREEIYCADIQEKEKTICQLREELEELKKPMNEKDFYMQVASLKSEIKMQRKQILDLSNHAEQNKEQH